MAPSEDLIDFEVIEAQKENIQSLPGGRSAKKLVDLFSPSPLHKLSTPTPSDTKNINDCIRAEYEAEIATLSESDDPLDVFDRYVRWTLDAYPAAQATPQSQLHLLLERATKAFIGSNQYKNDPRYMKMWLHYIQLFSDTPRETFMYLSRHGVGEGLALFYEEYAAWLESAGRWVQAEEVYKLGIEREARPQQRLIRKFGEFEQRRAQLPADEQDAPSSPALPTVRPALAAKVDPFAAAAAAARDPQAPRQHSGVGGPASKPGKSKMTIFSDEDAAPSAMSSRGPDSKGWDNIGSLADRKKENTIEPKPWAGETLNAGGRKASAKMAVFRDPSLVKAHITIMPSQYQMTVNPVNGKRERVYVDLEVVYPTPEEPGTELSFEEIWAAKRGMLDCTWDHRSEVPKSRLAPPIVDENGASQVNVLAEAMSTKLAIHSEIVMMDENGNLVKNSQSDSRPRKKKVLEINETQIIKAKLDSPSGPKIKKKRASMGGSSEPTMTMHTKAATDDIYDIFNQPLQPVAQAEETIASDDDYETDGDYTDGGESTGTTRQIATSEAGDDEDDDAVMTDVNDAEDASDIKSVSEWSEFSTRKHLPVLADGQEDQGHDAQADDEDVENEDDEVMSEVDLPNTQDDKDDDYQEEEEFGTPVDQQDLPQTRTSFVPIPPEDYSPPKRPYRDPAEVANNRLPFMTPITERTEHTLGFDPQYSDRSANAKTPSKGYRYEDTPPDSDGELPFSSPLLEIIREDLSPSRAPRVPQPLLPKAKPAAVAANALAPKGPIIQETQVNPLEERIRDEILAHSQPSLGPHNGFYDHRDEKYERGGEIRKYAKSMSQKGRRRSDRSSGDGVPVVVEFADTNTRYTVKRLLGEGSFAPVYLVENSDPQGAIEQDGDENAPVLMGKGAFATAFNKRSALEALKMETPPTSWEFHMMRLAHSRLGPQDRVTASIMPALECHLYRDETFLFLPLQPHGTLLDAINLHRKENSNNCDELLAMFFAIELFRTVEALHAKQIIHGDVKVDNCLLRLDSLSDWSPENGQLSSKYQANGSGGWGARGVTLIDFGRTIDMRAFTKDVSFIADWAPTSQDCAEIREGRPWTWQIDYHGLAGILYVMLFGDHIATVRCDSGGLGTGAGRRYRPKENLKRYWQTDIWQAAFDLLLNPGAHVDVEECARLPVLRGMKSVRESMEAWLEKNCQKGIGLKSLLAKVEAAARARC